MERVHLALRAAHGHLEIAVTGTDAHLDAGAGGRRRPAERVGEARLRDAGDAERALGARGAAGQDGGERGGRDCPLPHLGPLPGRTRQRHQDGLGCREDAPRRGPRRREHDRSLGDRPLLVQQALPSSRGSSPWLRVRSSTIARAAGSTTRGTPAASATAAIVRSSWVGPSPPVTITRAAPAAIGVRSASTRRSNLSGICAIPRTTTPLRSRSSASAGPLASRTRPRRTSSPLTTIAAAGAPAGRGSASGHPAHTRAGDDEVARPAGEGDHPIADAAPAARWGRRRASRRSARHASSGTRPPGSSRPRSPARRRCGHGPRSTNRPHPRPRPRSGPVRPPAAPSPSARSPRRPPWPPSSPGAESAPPARGRFPRPPSRRAGPRRSRRRSRARPTVPRSGARDAVPPAVAVRCWARGPGAPVPRSAARSARSATRTRRA